MNQILNRLVLSSVAVALIACASPCLVKNPAQSYANTEVYRKKNGDLLVYGDWDYIEYTTTKEDRPQLMIGGLCALIAQGTVRYFHYHEKHVLEWQASDMQETIDDHEISVKGLRYDRASLEHAAQGVGLTVAIPKSHFTQSFSGAYILGFLQRVDDVVKNPAASGAKPLTDRATDDEMRS